MKYIRIAAGFLLSCALAGCATTADDIADTKPVFTAVTERSATEYVQCVSDEWAEYGPIDQADLFRGRRLIVQSAGRPTYVLDAVKDRGNMKVRVYGNASADQQRLINAAADCL